MIIPDTKKAATVILSKMKSDGTSADTEVKPEENMDDSMEGYTAAAEDILHAVETKSVQGLATALKSFFEMCDSAPGSSDSSEE